jgi:hypothetical protein
MRRRFKGTSVGATEAGGEVAATEAGEGPERWTSGRKADVVLRLLRGEELAWGVKEVQSAEVRTPQFGHLMGFWRGTTDAGAARLEVVGENTEPDRKRAAPISPASQGGLGHRESQGGRRSTRSRRIN